MIKKKLFLFMVMVCTFMFMCICPIEFKSYADSYFLGSGTVEDPYQISSKGDLKQLSNLINNTETNKAYGTKYYIQTSDIDLGNESWTPIGIHWTSSDPYSDYLSFSGTYDGKGHSIKGLNVNSPQKYAGL